MHCVHRYHLDVVSILPEPTLRPIAQTHRLRLDTCVLHHDKRYPLPSLSSVCTTRTDKAFVLTLLEAECEYWIVMPSPYQQEVPENDRYATATTSGGRWPIVDSVLL